MLSGVSNATPAGAAPKVGSLGNREWQGRQRCTTTVRTAAKVGAPSATVRFGAEKNTAPRSAAAAGTSAQPAAALRPIIAWRTAAPATMSSSSTSQLTGGGSRRSPGSGCST